MSSKAPTMSSRGTKRRRISITPCRENNSKASKKKGLQNNPFFFTYQVFRTSNVAI